MTTRLLHDRIPSSQKAYLIINVRWYKQVFPFTSDKARERHLVIRTTRSSILSLIKRAERRIPEISYRHENGNRYYYRGISREAYSQTRTEDRVTVRKLLDHRTFKVPTGAES